MNNNLDWYWIQCGNNEIHWRVFPESRFFSFYLLNNVFHFNVLNNKNWFDPNFNQIRRRTSLLIHNELLYKIVSQLIEIWYQFLYFYQCCLNCWHMFDLIASKNTIKFEMINHSPLWRTTMIKNWFRLQCMHALTKCKLTPKLKPYCVVIFPLLHLVLLSKDNWIVHLFGSFLSR